MSETGKLSRQGGGLHIAFFVDAFPSLSITFIIDQILALLGRGHEITIFAQHPQSGDRVHPEVLEAGLLGRTTYLGPPRGPLGKSLGALAIGLGHPQRAWSVLRQLRGSGRPAPTGSWRVYFGALRFPPAARFDVAHCHFGPNGDLAGFLRSCGLLDSPFVVTYHGYDVRRLRSDGLADPYPYARRFAHRHLAISGYNRRALLDIGVPGDRIVDHPVAIDLDRFTYRARLGDDTGITRILTVANLVVEKGHVHALEALARVRQLRPDLQFHYRVVGDGPLRKSLAELARRRQLAERVEFCGGLARRDVIQELRTADIFLLPSVAEATPVVLMEAQACGIPVVATKVGAVSEVVRDGESGILVEPESPQTLSEALLHVLSHPQRWAEMGKCGRQHVQDHYDLVKVTGDLERIYRAAVQE